MPGVFFEEVSKMKPKFPFFLSQRTGGLLLLTCLGLISLGTILFSDSFIRARGVALSPAVGPSLAPLFKSLATAVPASDEVVPAAEPVVLRRAHPARHGHKAVAHLHHAAPAAAAEPAIPRVVVPLVAERALPLARRVVVHHETLLHSARVHHVGALARIALPIAPPPAPATFAPRRITVTAPPIPPRALVPVQTMTAPPPAAARLRPVDTVTAEPPSSSKLRPVETVTAAPPRT